MSHIERYAKSTLYWCRSFCFIFVDQPKHRPFLMFSHPNEFHRRMDKWSLYKAHLSGLHFSAIYLYKPWKRPKKETSEITWNWEGKEAHESFWPSEQQNKPLRMNKYEAKHNHWVANGKKSIRFKCNWIERIDLVSSCVSAAKKFCSYAWHVSSTTWI